MSFWVAVVLIVLIGAVTSIIHGRQRQGHGRLNEDPVARAEAQAAEKEIRELKERIAVLERIATDDRQSSDLADEIEDLRDK